MNSSVARAPKITPDEHQREAIEHVHGPMLVLAGAGTGKTTVLIQRIAHLIREEHAPPDQILALTYTDNAAEEMKKRVRAELAGRNCDGLQISTFHAWCNSLLHHRGAGFGVLDDKDLWVYLRRRLRDLRLKHFVRAANVSQFLDDLLDFMRRCQDELIGPEQYTEYVARLERGEISLPRVVNSKKQADLEEAAILERCHEIARVFATVEGMLEKENLGTFAHMITRAHALLKNDSAAKQKERLRARFLLIDEFQDVNFAQIEILSLLAGEAANIFAVGDPDQGIYRFRGASSEAFTLFVQHFPTARMIALHQNRRSLSPILHCAFGVVNENPPAFAQHADGIAYQRRPLESRREAEAADCGEAIHAQPVEIVTWRDKDVEAADLASRIKKKKKEQRCAWSDFAVLYRQHHHREELARELAARGIPFSIEGLDVLDAPEVRDVVACLSAAVTPNDAASLFRVAALPQFALEADGLRAAMRATRHHELDLLAVLSRLPNGPSVLADVSRAHEEVEREGVRAVDAIDLVMRRFALPISPPVGALRRFVEMWQDKPISESGSSAEFLEYLRYFRQAKGASIPLAASSDDAVRLLTAHAAKGLEFRHVAILRGSSTWFPCAYREPLVEFPPELRRSESALDDKLLYEQEERRLFYVAMTRAKDTLAIYAHQGRAKKDPVPTTFLREFMAQRRYKKFWYRRQAAAVQGTLFAHEERIAVSPSNAAAWLLMPPSPGFFTRLSATAIEIYEECPLRLKLEREWNLPRDIPASLHYGAAMHRVLRTFYDAQRFGREISNAELLEMFRADLASAGIPDRYQYELYLRQGKEQLEQFLEVVLGNPRVEVLETERRFEVEVHGAKLVGRMDRIDRCGDGVTIVDYKTGKPRSQEDTDTSLQLSLYALAAKESLGKRAELLIFYNLENNTAITTTRSDTELEDAKARVEDVAKKIDRAEFPAKVGYHCVLCPYRNLCPATEKNLPVPQKSAGRVN